jgi:putative flippase GtrA
VSRCGRVEPREARVLLDRECASLRFSHRRSMKELGKLPSQDYLRELTKGFVKFAIVGGIGYFEGLGIFYGETRYLHVFDLFALTVSFVIVVFSNLVGNILNRNIRLEKLEEFPSVALKFYVTSTLGYFVGISIYFVETRYLSMFDLLALTISTGLVSLSNYGGNIVLRNIRIAEKAKADD